MTTRIIVFENTEIELVQVGGFVSSAYKVKHCKEGLKLEQIDYPDSLDDLD